MITEWINLKESKHFDPSGVKQKYVRNFITNVSEIIDNVGKLEGVVSKETQLQMLPSEIVKSAAEEMKRIREEAEQEEGLFQEPLED